MPTTTNYGWTTPADTDLVKDGARQTVDRSVRPAQSAQAECAITEEGQAKPGFQRACGQQVGRFWLKRRGQL